jgi:hypothetical protein
MKTTPQNSQGLPPIDASTPIRKTTSKPQYPRRDFYFSLFYPDVDQTFQAIDPNGNKGYAQADILSEYDDDQEIGRREILDPEREENEIMDPKKDHREREFPNQHDEEDINPNRNVPEEENDLTEDDGAIIKEPTREIDDPYRPGHADEENIPPIEEEFPNEDLKENIKTDF